MIIAQNAKSRTSTFCTVVCKDSDTGAFRKGLMEEFQIWLQKEKTEPNLEQFQTLGLQSWIDDPMGRGPEYVVHSQNGNQRLQHKLIWDGTPFFADSTIRAKRGLSPGSN